MKKNDMRMNGARIGFQSHYANLSGFLKNRSLLENNIKSKPKVTKTFFETKILFKEMPNLLIYGFSQFSQLLSNPAIAFIVFKFC